ncbi:MAG: hypothetical protein JW993_02600 [Sedimentisphaerales bacterium]|nr:hypothetical protein [Sedimentisphaerales bacterium]
MKADHRHELKTNELAEWIGNLPQWAQENRTTLMAVGAVVVVALGVYFVRFYRRDSALERQQVHLTNLVTQLPNELERVAAGLAQGSDQSMSLVPLARDLGDFAENTPNREMAAVALIKRAEALRAELHYRLEGASREEIARQIASAQQSYREALERAGSVPALAAAAQFGLGLCEEELGNFEQAREIYTRVANEKDYSGTTAQAAAAHRLTTMDDYRTIVVFKPAPPKPVTPTTPTLQFTPDNVFGPNQVPIAPNEPNVSTPNTPGQGGETDGTEVSEVNAPAQSDEPAGRPAETPVREADTPSGN